MLSEFFQKSPENSQTLGPMLCSEYLELGIVSCCAVVVEPFHGGPPDPLTPLGGGCGSFLEPIVELLDFVDDTMLFEVLVLFVVEIGNQRQSGLSEAGALHE